jgi:hypothetical protein
MFLGDVGILYVFYSKCSSKLSTLNLGSLGGGGAVKEIDMANPCCPLWDEAPQIGGRR